jgi:hypothetical protein
MIIEATCDFTLGKNEVISRGDRFLVRERTEVVNGETCYVSVSARGRAFPAHRFWEVPSIRIRAVKSFNMGQRIVHKGETFEVDKQTEDLDGDLCYRMGVGSTYQVAPCGYFEVIDAPTVTPAPEPKSERSAADIAAELEEFLAASESVELPSNFGRF